MYHSVSMLHGVPMVFYVFPIEKYDFPWISGSFSLSFHAEERRLAEARRYWGLQIGTFGADNLNPLVKINEKWVPKILLLITKNSWNVDSLYADVYINLAILPQMEL